ncbi:4Fe-4S dicluster domain-containing protein [Vibrio hangzhouensis]|uniref:4Fe-4S dicluster domain-containing protein n=1 Tax=Vibrio hangzhouensis TaxID=462991 RepID=UPI001C98C2C5|nr:4Fe-4S dicluster domain-containing protein [Vibrio hangzhouensis]MBY6196419.1 4Fe-4S dicluster domain-containing protein [Vibrio hangzhouensis]
MNNSSNTQKGWLGKAHFHSLFEALQRQGYKIIGPTPRDNTIVFDTVTSPSDLAHSVIDQQQPGSYRLVKDKSNRYFSWNTGPQALKPLLFTPRQTLWTCSEYDGELQFKSPYQHIEPIAVIGVRACDLAALAIHDQHFLHGAYSDNFYQKRRENILLVAVNCGRSNEQCFCVSTGDGPEVTFYYDVLLDELDDGFVVRSGSEQGLEIVRQLKLKPATQAQEQAAKRLITKAKREQGNRKLPELDQLIKLVDGLKKRDWQNVAERCLACGNCTQVCPTCFCSTQESNPDLLQSSSEQVRIWDTCFSEKHGHIFGKNYRPEIGERYRQWILHKLVFWHQQYGRSGCVGCGRCSTWCPVAIDLVEEASSLADRMPLNNP